MENTETKSAIQNAASETAESARKVGGKLRAFAGSAADASTRWAKRCGEMLTEGGRRATLQTQQRVLQTKLDRAHRELGRTVHALLDKGEAAVSLTEAPQFLGALEKAKEMAANLQENGDKLADLRKTGKSGDAPSS
jgi:hypothetical protein